MIEFSQVFIDQLVIHHIGCKAQGEPVKFSRTPYQMQNDDAVGELLINYFFRPFKSEAFFHFAHDEDVSLNEAYRLALQLFDEPLSFLEVSVKLAERLYEASNHAMIRGGEFYMVLFRNVVVDGEVTDGLGIFKSETKETFLKVYLKDQNFELGAQEGINVKRLDKGCIIFNTEREQGLKVCSIDNVNKGNEARFWRDDFLGLKPREDNYYYTNNYMKMCREFIGEVFNAENRVPKADQIDILNRSVDYFNKKDNFSEDDFAHEVIRQPEAISAFNQFKEFYEAEQECPLPTEFDISKSAVKGEKKFFKSILKLDKNFHVYIHGKKNYIERGFDNEKGLNFYKLFFEQES
ncbi:MAG: nucleoid-associated protein [Marinilabiliaceae bacterium]|nr:nucleoid-associated protein [Marinilabiliaceae bacterium]